jgi:hypothetical protein
MNTSLAFFPSFIPTVFNLEDITGVDKEINEEDLQFIPL